MNVLAAMIWAYFRNGNDLRDQEFQIEKWIYETKSEHKKNKKKKKREKSSQRISTRSLIFRFSSSYQPLIALEKRGWLKVGW